MKLYVGKADLYFGDAGGSNFDSTPSLKTVDGIEVSYKPDFQPVMLEDYDHAVLYLRKGEVTEVTFNLAQADLTAWAIAVAGTAVTGSTLKLGTVRPIAVSVKIVGTAVGADGAASHTMTTILNYAMATGEVKAGYKKGELNVVSVTMSVLADTTVDADAGDALEMTEASV